MAVKGHLAKELDTLAEHQLREVAEYVAFLKFRSRFIASPSVDEEELTKLYGEFAEEDRQLYKTWRDMVGQSESNAWLRTSRHSTCAHFSDRFT
jgi:hypothetical protein